MNEQLCFNDWTVKVCEELARFGLTAERLVPWGFPWSLWWDRGAFKSAAVEGPAVKPRDDVCSLDQRAAVGGGASRGPKVATTAWAS